MNRATIIWVGLIAGILEPHSPAFSQESQAALPTLQRLHSVLGPVFQRHFPQATSTVTAEGVHFEADTRAFLIHLPLLTGAWQEAREIKGPNRNGILCDIRMVRGKYDGQATLPQTFDNRYFKTLVTAVPSPSQHEYLHVHLSYPDSVDSLFLKEFTDQLDVFWTSGK
jgi:hypothetical protein